MSSSQPPDSVLHMQQQLDERNAMQQKVEDLEQALIQHLRTAGIRKPRETALIDEVMDLRKHRRRLLAAVNAQLAVLQQENQQLGA